MKINSNAAASAADRAAEAHRDCLAIVGEDYFETATTPAVILMWTAQNARSAAAAAAEAALALAPEGTLLTRGTPEADAVLAASTAAEEAEKAARHCWEVLNHLAQTGEVHHG